MGAMEETFETATRDATIATASKVATGGGAAMTTIAPQLPGRGSGTIVQSSVARSCESEPKTNVTSVPSARGAWSGASLHRQTGPTSAIVSASEETTVEATGARRPMLRRRRVRSSCVRKCLVLQWNRRVAALRPYPSRGARAGARDVESHVESLREKPASAKGAAATSRAASAGGIGTSGLLRN